MSEEEAPITVYYIWITAMLSQYAETLISKMVKLGYRVGPACEGQLIIGNSNQPSVIIALRIESNKASINTIYKDISNIIRSNNIFIYSIVISEATACTWNCSNIVLPETGSKKTDVN